MKKKEKKPVEDANLILHKFVGRYSNTTLLELFVYKDMKSMQEAAQKHPRWGGRLGVESAACFAKGSTPNVKEAIRSKDTGHYYDVFGAIFLSVEDLELHVIAHECMHAALCWAYYIVRNIGILGKGGLSEELVVSAADELFENILKVLGANGIEVKLPKFEYDQRSYIEFNTIQ